MVRQWRQAFFTGIALAGMGAPLFAQAGAGELVGMVTDATGAAVPQGRIALSDPSTGLREMTEASGSAPFLCVPAAGFVSARRVEQRIQGMAA